MLDSLTFYDTPKCLLQPLSRFELSTLCISDIEKEGP